MRPFVLQAQSCQLHACHSCPRVHAACCLSAARAHGQTASACRPSRPRHCQRGRPGCLGGPSGRALQQGRRVHHRPLHVRTAALHIRTHMPPALTQCMGCQFLDPVGGMHWAWHSAADRSVRAFPCVLLRLQARVAATTLACSCEPLAQSSAVHHTRASAPRAGTAF